MFTWNFTWKANFKFKECYSWNPDKDAPGGSSRISLNISFFLLFLNCSLDKVRDYVFLEVHYLLDDVAKL